MVDVKSETPASAPVAEYALDGRTVLVTGSTTGLGLATALRLGALGARVAMNYAHDVDRAERAFQTLESTGCTCGLYRASVTDEKAVRSMFETITADLGPVDVVVVNATPNQPQLALEEYTWDDYQRMLDFFVKSPFLLAREALPHGRAVIPCANGKARIEPSVAWLASAQNQQHQE